MQLANFALRYCEVDHNVPYLRWLWRTTRIASLDRIGAPKPHLSSMHLMTRTVTRQLIDAITRPAIRPCCATTPRHRSTSCPGEGVVHRCAPSALRKTTETIKPFHRPPAQTR